MKISSPERLPRLPVQVANAIMKEIEEGRIRPGDKLPTEQFLVDSLGVSRNVVREAIAQLKAKGVLQSRQGVGTIVIDPVNVPVAAHSLPFNSHTRGQVYEIRAILEPRGAGLAALRADAEQIAAISATLQEMEGDQWENLAVEADIRFHIAVARASGNPFIEETIKYLSEGLRETISTTKRRSGELVGDIKAITIREHAAVRDAILAGSPEDARRAMANHICGAAARIGYDLPTDDL